VEYRLYDPILIAAFIISIFSAIFVAIKEGVGLTLDYRESETTSRRKKEIDDKLREEVKKELKKSRKRDISTKVDDEEVFEQTEALGRSAFLARSITEKMLDSMSLYMKNAFKNLAGALIALFFTLVLGLEFGDLSQWLSFIPALPYAILTAMSLVLATKNLRKYYFIREEFVRLSENPNLEYCLELYEELTERGLW